jgi:hypothetical protein
MPGIFQSKTLVASESLIGLDSLLRDRPAFVG